MKYHLQKGLKLAICILFTVFFYEIDSLAQTLTISNLPIVLINTEGQTINDEPGIVCSLSIINNSSGTNTIGDPPNEFDGKAKVEYRGCSSQNFPKKPLGIELRSTTATTSSINIPLFGFPAESDWVLNPAYTDKTFTRDALAFYLATASGRYASRTKYVEVVINGQYEGIYIFEEKVKRDAGRINVTKLDPGDLGANSITGGYVVKVDKTCGNYDPTHRWASAYSSPDGTQPHYWQTDYPNDASIASQQFTYIKNYINAFETTMASSTYCSGYTSYIADSTFVDYLLVEEIASNSDAYRFSTYFAKERNSKGGKLSAGPVWDFNLAFGFLTSPFNSNTQSYQGWRYTAPGDPSFPVPFWWEKLVSCPDFGAKLVTRYQQLRQTVWSTPALVAFIDARYNLLNQGAFDRNFQKWPIIGVSTWNDNPSYNGATLPDEFNYLKTWLSNRLDWMDNNICSFTSQPIATISGNPTPIQEGQPTSLSLTFTGSGPWSYTLSSGLSGSATSGKAILSVMPNQTTAYTIQAIENGCGTGTASGTAIVTVIPVPADLSLSLTTNRRIVTPGDTISMEVSLTNAGPGTARSVQIENRLPAGMAFAGSSLSTISQANNLITITVDSVEANQTSFYAYTIKVIEDGMFLNSAQITASSRPDPDSQPNSGTGDGQDDESSVDLRTPNATGSINVSPNPNQTPLPTVQASQPPTDLAKADLSLSASFSQIVVAPNQIIQLTLTVANRGGATANNVTLQSLLPPGWQLTVTTGLTINGQSVTGNMGSIAAGSSGSIVLFMQVPSSGTLRAQILSATPTDTDSTPGNGYTNGEDDEVAVSVRTIQSGQ